jgi:hypothetical protein
MADFSDPKYASYRGVCKDLGLPHPARIGDWYMNMWASFTEFEVKLISDKMQSFFLKLPTIEEYGGSFWLPTLADWLEMLETAGYKAVRIEPTGTDGWLVRRDSDWEPLGAGPTREEAAARLWIAVTSHAF